MNIVLSPKDERLGKYNADGSFQEWPVSDVFGGTYEKINAIVHRLSADNFIVVPPGREHEIETISFDKSTQPQTVAPVSQQVAKRKDEGSASS